jgi:hypothetical protein
MSTVRKQRRTLLHLPFAALTKRLMPFSPLAAALHSQPARAEPVTIALAVAGAAVSLIQANNQSDGGLSATLQAGLDYHRLAAQQLLSIQDALKEVLLRLNGLGAEVEHIFLKSRLASLSTDLRGAIIRYRDELEGANDYRSYQEWQSNEHVRTRLKDISREVDAAVSKLEAENWLNATTAMMFPSAMNLTFAVRTALGENRDQLAGPARKFWNLFDLVRDGKQPGSTAKELELLNQSLQAELHILKSFGMTIPDNESILSREALLMVITVQDYTGPQRHTVFVQQKPTPLQSRMGEAGTIVERARVNPERFGERSTFAITSKVPNIVVEAAPGSTGIRQLGLPAPISVSRYFRHAYMSSVQPSDDQISVSRYEARDEVSRKAALEALGVMAEGEKRREALTLSIAKYNSICSRIALCLAALNLAVQTQSSLARSFGAAR